MRAVYPLAIGLLLFAGVILLSTSADDKEVVQNERPTPLPVTNCAAPLPPSLSFAGEPVPLHDPEVAERVDRELLTNMFWHSSTFQIMKHAHRWMPKIEKALAEHGIPEDFKYLVAIESGFKNVVSSAGAAGFWQIMPATGRQFGLKITSEIDERYHFDKAADAACRLLKQSYDELGSWALAAAAYNMGPARTKREVAAQKVESYFDLHLNNETSRYVPRLLAMKLILSDPGTYGFCLEENDLYQAWETRDIVVQASISDLATWAVEQGTTLKTVRYLNPWIINRSLTIPAGGELTLQLPA